jgi:hypothetical protein
MLDFGKKDTTDVWPRWPTEIKQQNAAQVAVDEIKLG